MQFAGLRRYLLAGALLGAGLVIEACSDASDIGPGGVVEVRITPDTIFVVAGRVDTAAAFPLDGDHAFVADKTIDWSTANTGVATVDSKGVITGVAVGTTEISATVGSIVGTGTVVVEPSPALHFAPDTARLNAVAGSPTPVTSDDSVTNSGGGSITGLAIDSITYVGTPTGWLQATLSSAATPATAHLTSDPSGLPLGRHIALVWMSSPDLPAPVALPASVDAVAGAAASLTIQAGNAQTSTVNTAVGVNPSVLVRDGFNNPVAGTTVTFAVASGGGSVTGALATTNASGVATVGSWSLGTTAGANSLTATEATLPASPATFTATGTAGPASQLLLNGGNNQAAIAGNSVAVAPSVKTADQFGNGVSGISVTFAVASGGGSITGGAQTSNASGIATVGSWTLGSAAGPNSLSATSAGLTGSPVTILATGNPGNATNIAAVSGGGQTATVNTILGTAFVVRVTDTNGNPVSGVTVGWSVVGNGSMNPSSSSTDVNGLASSTRTLGTVAGTQTANATVAGLIGSPVAFTATANAGAPASIAINAGNGQSVTVNSAAATPPSVIVRDQFSNPVSGASVTFTVGGTGGAVNCGPGNTTSCAASSGVNGVAAVTSWTMGTVAQGYSLGASLGAFNATFNATGTPGPLNFLALLAGGSQLGRPGTQVGTNPNVGLFDQFANQVNNATVTVTFTITTPAGNGGSTINCGSGATTTSCSITTSNGSAPLTQFIFGSSGLPTAAVPFAGQYINTIIASAPGVTNLTINGFARWSFATDVQPIFTSVCAGCHSAGGFSPRLDAGNSYNAIRGVSSGACGFYVDASNINVTGTSFLFQKITTAVPCRGSQMPTAGSISTTQVNIIRDWINNQSPNN